MKKNAPAIALLALFLGFAAPLCAQTENRPHLDLIRGLRANSMPDLALEYLLELEKSRPDPAISVVLPLEFAKTWLDQAAVEREENRRNDLIAKAKEKIEVFLKTAVGHPLIPQANIELARLNSLKGKALLSKVGRIDKEMKEQYSKALEEARKPLAEAVAKYQASLAPIDAELKKLAGDKSPNAAIQRQELSRFRLNSLLDQAITLYELGSTYSLDSATEGQLRSKNMESARNIFEKVMYIDDKEPICWIARAWFAQCNFSLGEEKKFESAYKDFINKRNNPAAAAGLRVARYFNVLNNFQQGSVQKAEQLEKDATEWLRDYSAYRETREGLGARYFLALIKFRLGQRDLIIDKNRKITGFKSVDGKNRFESAQRLFHELSEGDSEYSERAYRFRSNILVALADADGHGDAPPPESLASFELCYLMAQVQFARLNQFRTNLTSPPPQPATPATPSDPKTPPKKGSGGAKSEPKAAPSQKQPAAPVNIEEAIKVEEHKRITMAMRYLERGISIATGRESVRDRFNAELLLVQCYRQLRMLPQAAILADYLSRTFPKLPRASLAGQVAIECYNSAYRSGRSKPANPEDAPAMPLADMRLLVSSAEYVRATWPLEPAADFARHILGFFYSKEKEYLKSLKYYIEIHDTYPAVMSARLDLGRALMFLINPPSEEKNAKIREQKILDNIKQYSEVQNGAYWPRTLEVLEKIPKPPFECPASEAIAYLETRSILAVLFQMKGDFKKLQELASAMADNVNKFTNIPEARRADLSDVAKNLKLNGMRAIAFNLYQKDKKYSAVSDTLKPAIEEMAKDFSKPVRESLFARKVRDSQRNILMLSLQNSIHEQKIERATELMDLLDKSGSSLEDGQTLLRALVASFKAQIDDLEKLNTPESVAESKKLKEGFTNLLDKVYAKGEKLPTSMKLFIAQGYSGIQAYDKATKLLEDLLKEPAPKKPDPIPADADDKKQLAYREAMLAFENHERKIKQVQFYLVRNYRQAKDYPAATKLLDQIIGPITKAAPVPKPNLRGWAFGSMEVRRLKANMLEEMAQNAKKGSPEKLKMWGAAVGEWQAIMKAFAPQLPPPPTDISKIVDPKLVPDDIKVLAKKIVSGKEAEIKTAKSKLLDLMRRFNNPKTFEDAVAVLKSFAMTLDDMQQKQDFDTVITNLQTEVMNYRQKRSSDQANAVAKRKTYFELYFETKRCSVAAYTDVGLAGVKGGAQADLDAKFANLAKDFIEVRSKNKDFPEELKIKIDELMKANSKLKAGQKQYLAGN